MEKGIVRAIQDYYGILRSPTQLIMNTANFTSEFVPLRAQAMLCRAGKLALSNVARHAQAQKVEINLCAISSSAYMIIEDNGIGFDPVLINHRESYGLRSLKELLRDCGGTCDILATPGNGTRISIEIPLKTVDGGCSSWDNQSECI